MRINLTGFTNGQKTGKNKKNVIGIANTIKDLLVDLGYEADYGLENPDINIISVLDLSSINSSNAVNCLDLLATNEKCILMFDDWNIKGFYKGIDKVLETKKFSKTHHSVDYEGVLRNLPVLQKIANGELPVIFPAYKTGDHELLEIRGDKYCIDPSIYISKELPTSEQSLDELIPVHASLATKWSTLEKKKYTILNVRNETEDDVFNYYWKHRIVIAPSHYHNGSGWFRNRYTLAYLANSLIIEEEDSCFGEHYEVERKAVSKTTFDYLLAQQRKAYENTIMTKEEIKETLCLLFNNYNV